MNRSSFKPVSLLLIYFFVLLVAGCGKYGPPLPPEVFAPAPVNNLEAVAAPDGILISWFAPQVDRRGRELTAIEGYRVFRMDDVFGTQEPEREARPSDYEELDFIPDSHIEVREQLRKEARERGEIARRVRVDAELTTFSYFDSSVQAGHSYIYKIVPFGRGAEGDVNRMIQVLFRGETSDISLVTRRDLSF